MEFNMTMRGVQLIKLRDRLKKEAQEEYDWASVSEDKEVELLHITAMDIKDKISKEIDSIIYPEPTK